MKRWVRAALLAGILLTVPAGLTTGQAQVCETETCTKRPAPPPGLAADQLPEDVAPPVVGLGYDPQLLGDRMYQRISGPIPVTASPGGEVLREMPPCFTFVTTQGAEGAFTLINPGEWVSSAVLTPVWPSTFSGVFLEQPWDYPMGWMLR